MPRQELGRGVWYDSAVKGYAMLDVTEHISDVSPTQVDGVQLMPKHEYHVSIANVRGLADGNRAVEAAMVRLLEGYLGDERQVFGWLGLTNRYYVCHKPNEQGEQQTTVIGEAEILGLEGLERAMRHQFGEHIRLSQPHVTLLKSANSPYGIGVNNAEELALYCEYRSELAAVIRQESAIISSATEV